MQIFGIIGLLAIIIGILKRSDKLIDEVCLIIGGVCLTAYSMYLGDFIFIILQIVFTAVAVYDLFRAIKNRKRKI